MLAALVTASKHLNNVRNQAVDPRRRVPFRLKQINSQTTADGLVQDLAHFNEIWDHTLRQATSVTDISQTSTEEPTCRHPDCRWVSLYLNNREHNTVDPCSDLYGHACNHQWRGSGEYPFGQHSFRQLAVGTMVANLHNYFNRTSKQTFQDQVKGRFLHQVSSLYMDCIIEYKGKNEGDALQEALKDFHIHETNHDENLTSILGSLDRELRVFPFVTVSLAPDTLRVTVTASTTLLKRYFLSAEGPTDEDYTRILGQAMALLKPETDVRKHAQNVHDFERKLQSSIVVLVRAQKQRSAPILVHNSWDEYTLSGSGTSTSTPSWPSGEVSACLTYRSHLRTFFSDCQPSSERRTRALFSTTSVTDSSYLSPRSCRRTSASCFHSATRTTKPRYRSGP
ncbi:hypothetical protein HPB51_022768 [Rhipicephalus microplus]|uniref:Peptidase M13 N-terminal domain-containing protein n=1 Tax=Rhipicephalus microplus TaxID=6941 RepID=A0A9J6ECF9_RHIMP|nr:hypothetical protein HPB51_022768 [Rhipicephalus microplus]